MKTKKTGNLAILVAFCLIATILTCTVAIAAGNIQLSPDADPDSGNADKDKLDQNGDSDENKDGDNTGDGPNEDDIPVVQPLPEFMHSITGLAISSEESIIRPYCFVTASDSPLYGLSSSYLTVEIPVENGKTRLLMFTDSPKSIGKLGSIAPTRDYINTVANAFGANVFSYGNDGKSGIQSKDNLLDFKTNLGYHYTEYTEFVYTNGDLITAFTKNMGATTVRQSKTVIPYKFIGYYDEAIKGTGADTVTVLHGEGNSTELTYNKTEGKYLLTKNSNPKNDSLNDKPATFTNVFILYTDSTTYENEDSTTTVLNTNGSGKGYYITGGGHTEFAWKTDADGNLSFTTPDGDILTVNRGSSYICFVKSSKMSSVTIS